MQPARHELQHLHASHPRICPPVYDMRFMCRHQECTADLLEGWLCASGGGAGAHHLCAHGYRSGRHCGAYRAHRAAHPLICHHSASRGSRAAARSPPSQRRADAASPTCSSACGGACASCCARACCACCACAHARGAERAAPCDYAYGTCSPARTDAAGTHSDAAASGAHGNAAAAGTCSGAAATGSAGAAAAAACACANADTSGRSPDDLAGKPMHILDFTSELGMAGKIIHNMHMGSEVWRALRAV